MTVLKLSPAKVISSTFRMVRLSSTASSVVVTRLLRGRGPSSICQGNLSSSLLHDEPAYRGSDLDVEMVSMTPIVIGREHHVEESPLGRGAVDRVKRSCLRRVRRRRRGSGAARSLADPTIGIGLDVERRAAFPL